jgi:hypothetical protein
VYNVVTEASGYFSLTLKNQQGKTLQLESIHNIFSINRMNLEDPKKYIILESLWLVH